MSSPVVCPRCGSAHMVTRDYARKACGALGAVAGAAIILNKEKESGSLSPVGALVSIAAISVATPIMKALLGGAAGCATGATVGSTIDEIVLNNHECLACGMVFGKSRP